MRCTSYFGTAVTTDVKVKAMSAHLDPASSAFYTAALELVLVLVGNHVYLL